MCFFISSIRRFDSSVKEKSSLQQRACDPPLLLAGSAFFPGLLQHPSRRCSGSQVLAWFSVVLKAAEGSPTPSGGCSVGCSLPAADSPHCCFAACKRRYPVKGSASNPEHCQHPDFFFFRKEIAKRSSWICLVLFLIFVSSLTGSYTGVLFARRFWITDFMQMLSLQTVPCIMNSGNLLTDQTQGIENQKKGVPYLTEDHGTVMKVIQYLRGAVSVKPRENCFAKSDWVWKSAGVSIDLQRSSGPAWHCRVAWFLCSPNMLETFEQVDISPGFCWPLKASLNSVVFNLPSKVLPTAVTVQHDTDITLWDISSAPRNFVVFGLDKEGENVAILGKFTYDISKELTQTFELQTGTPRAFWYIKFVVLSNWGSAGQTCIYRVQVHGKTVGTNDIS
uniref:SUN domain-containing protein 3-like n=1 Tax=Coturnix japonica TaxID=93934 RepID=A0A8C2Y8W1_COTJA